MMIISFDFLIMFDIFNYSRVYIKFLSNCYLILSNILCLEFNNLKEKVKSMVASEKGSF